MSSWLHVTRHSPFWKKYRWAYYRLWRAESLLRKTKKHVRSGECEALDKIADAVRELADDFDAKRKLAEEQEKNRGGGL